jgi:hypothetical protein
LAAGGGGVAAGTAILAVMGPIGWAVAGVGVGALVAGGCLLANALGEED